MVNRHIPTSLTLIPRASTCAEPANTCTEVFSNWRWRRRLSCFALDLRIIPAHRVRPRVAQWTLVGEGYGGRRSIGHGAKKPSFARQVPCSCESDRSYELDRDMWVWTGHCGRLSYPHDRNALHCAGYDRVVNWRPRRQKFEYSPRVILFPWTRTRNNKNAFASCSHASPKHLIRRHWRTCEMNFGICWQHWLLFRSRAFVRSGSSQW